VKKLLIISLLLLVGLNIFGQEEKESIDSSPSYQLGDFAQGGVIFWLDKAKQHGLVCAKEDQSSQITWSTGAPIRTMALGDGLHAGESNTTIIIAIQGYGDMKPYAASICNELQIEEDGINYGDWYLPSRDELNLMYHSRKTIDSTSIHNGGKAFFNGTMNDVRTSYWSSTEVDIRKDNKSTEHSDDDHGAWQHNFKRGNKTKQIPSKKSLIHSVRAVRAF
jgi:hypothetical protein